ncbi:hypothetical protein IMCC3317_34140 [Kordia antarctica]|uniref:Uncharacterized protein n=1 Tax=Kordia antarctica TaxID=1218801 RepID=A0A7L4ZNF4_9FLAO|nr:hypothetical protein [Kordia antarctica]QHI38030.1 hypothetical protein IMCC3317_34140 [Kordia antarctica]
MQFTEGLQTFKKIINQLTDIINISEKNYNKKFILDQIFKNNLSAIYNVNNGIILKTIAADFIFYEDTYWDLFRDHFEKNNWDINIVLPFLKNHELFLFESNHTRLIVVFLDLFENKKNFSKIRTDQIKGELLEFISQILLILKWVENIDLKHKILSLIEKILLDKKVLKLCYYEVHDLTPVFYLLTYILFYFYNPVLKEFLIEINIYEKINKEVGAKTIILDNLIEFTKNKYYGIEMKEVNKFKPVLGDLFYKELIDLINQRLINKEEFNPEKFDNLLQENKELHKNLGQ